MLVPKCGWVRFRITREWRGTTYIGIAGAGVVLLACGASSSSASSATTSAVKSTAGAITGAVKDPGIIVGEITQLAPGSFTLDQIGKPTVSFGYTSTTRFALRKLVALSSLAIGECATALGSLNSTGVLTARLMSVSPSSPIGSVRRFRAGFGGRRAKKGTFVSRPSFAGHTPPFGRSPLTPVVGVIASIAGETLEVQFTGTQTSVVVGPSDVITSTLSATSTSHGAHLCATVLSSSPVSSATTSVTARSVTVLSATSQGCRTGRGGCAGSIAG